MDYFSSNNMLNNIGKMPANAYNSAPRKAGSKRI